MNVQWKINSPVGPLYLMASNQYLLGVFWKKQDCILLKKLNLDTPAEKIIQKTVQQLEEYFNRKRKNFSLPLLQEGTVFQKKVWSELAVIPYGATNSYSDIAKKINNKKAVRAVGTANGSNPHTIIIPCHRVIAADGTLGGYAGGLKNKKILLDLERPL